MRHYLRNRQICVVFYLTGGLRMKMVKYVDVCAAMHVYKSYVKILQRPSVEVGTLYADASVEKNRKQPAETHQRGV